MYSRIRKTGYTEIDKEAGVPQRMKIQRRSACLFYVSADAFRSRFSCLSAAKVGKTIYRISRIFGEERPELCGIEEGAVAKGFPLPWRFIRIEIKIGELQRLRPVF